MFWPIVLNISTIAEMIPKNTNTCLKYFECFEKYLNGFETFETFLKHSGILLDSYMLCWYRRQRCRCVRLRSYVDAYIHAQTHTYVHAQTHTYVHTNIHLLMCSPWSNLGRSGLPTGILKTFEWVIFPVPRRNGSQACSLQKIKPRGMKRGSRRHIFQHIHIWHTSMIYTHVYTDNAN